MNGRRNPLRSRQQQTGFPILLDFVRCGFLYYIFQCFLELLGIFLAKSSILKAGACTPYNKEAVIIGTESRSITFRREV